jgi:hypothetical protein
VNRCVVKKSSTHLFKKVLNLCAKNQGRARLQTSRCVAIPAPKTGPNAVLAAAAVEILALLTLARTGAVRPVCAIILVCRCDPEATAGWATRGWPGDVRADRTTRGSFKRRKERPRTRGHAICTLLRQQVFSPSTSEGTSNCYPKHQARARLRTSTSVAAPAPKTRPEAAAAAAAADNITCWLLTLTSTRGAQPVCAITLICRCDPEATAGWATRGRPGDVRAGRTTRGPFERHEDRPRTQGPAMRRESGPSNNERREARLAGRCGTRPVGDTTPGQETRGQPGAGRDATRPAERRERKSGRCCASSGAFSFQWLLLWWSSALRVCVSSFS